MDKTALRNVLGLALLASVFGLGCGQQGGGGAKTYPVSGIVTYRGQPVEGATVAFQSSTGAEGAFGVSDASGKYSLTTFTSGDGAVPGQYKVKVFKYQGAEGGAAAADQDSDDYVPPTEGAAEPTATQNVLPAKYADPNTSGLTATVGEEKNSLDFDLQD
jgi:hypothetical protein